MEDLVLFYPEKHELHFETGHPERPERVEAIRIALEKPGLWEKTSKLSPQKIPENILYSIHELTYLDEIRLASQNGLRPDMDTYLTKHSWQLALNSAGGGIAVSEAVWNRDAKHGFALCRPPGHHATADQAMGFCILNNIALAAENLLQNQGARKIAIIDLDVHHGNGTQDIFWSRNDVLFFSVHQVPLYPGTGYINEIGIGDGEGFTVNIPLPPHSGDQARLHAMQGIILPMLADYQPEILLISIGFDAHWKDPLAQQLATVDNYGQMISSLSEFADQYCQGRLSVFLEGGYDLQAGAASALATSQALLGNLWEDPLGKGPKSETDQWALILERVKDQWGL